jgi:phosphatidylinositol-3-phosphatase
MQIGRILINGLFLSIAVAAHAAERIRVFPRYEHIFVIIAENRNYQQIIGNVNAPKINHLAATYGLSTQFFAEVHPSEGNYLAMLGGDTFGIHDDDAWYCKPGMLDRYCPSASVASSYVDHTVRARSLMNQLSERRLSWKGYFESIPALGSKAVFYPNAQNPVAGLPNMLYASKHNGLINFSTVQNDHALTHKLVGFDELFTDLASGHVPNYAYIAPNECNDMHGLDGANVPSDCDYRNDQELIARGDTVIGDLVARIQASPVWARRGNVAIVVTWDEDDDEGSDGQRSRDPPGCCGFDPSSPANFGGGHIPTLVITNHGPRMLNDNTPYNHYSLLLTTEEAFGINEHLGHANDTAAGVRSMLRLFDVQ